jgi:hypothetical protein
MKGQLKRYSLLEKFLDIGSGFIIAYFAWKYVVAPAIHSGVLNVDDSLLITIIFTIISFVRGYAWRRAFNHFHVKEVL